MGTVWQVQYEGESIAMARKVIEQALADDNGESAIVRCGGAGAIWNADGRMRGPVFVVELLPFDPHDVDPTYRPSELPMPTRLVAGLGAF